MNKNRLPYKKNPGFRTPPGYMENLEERLFNKLIPEKEEPARLPKPEKAFAVPEDYFAQLDERLMERVREQNPNQSKLINLMNNEILYYVAGVAAVLIAVITNPLQEATTPTSNDEMVDMLILETYIDETIDHSTPEVSRMISEEVFTFAPSGEANAIDHEAVLEYLQENLEEPSLIYNED